MYTTPQQSREAIERLCGASVDFVDGEPVSAGRFTVDSDSIPTPASFELDAADVEAASAYVLTIEPAASTWRAIRLTV